MLLLKNQMDRLPAGSIFRSLTGIMRFDSVLNIVRDTGVDGAITAFDHIDKPGRFFTVHKLKSGMNPAATIKKIKRRLKAFGYHIYTNH